MTGHPARRRILREVDSVRQEAGTGEQNRCPHGNDDCSGPGGRGLPCAKCFWERDSA